MPNAGKLLLGIDAGTTLLKAAIYTPEGHCLGAGESPQGVSSPRPGWCEQDPFDWWQGLIAATRQALTNANANGTQIGAIGLSTQGGTLAVFDEEGNPKGPALVWNDARQRASQPQPQELLDEHFVQCGISHRNGTPVALRWLKEYQPAWFASSFRIGYVPDYLTFRLTGQWISDSTNLSISNICALADGDIAPTILEHAGMTRVAFAKTQPAGQCAGVLQNEAAQELGLLAGIPVATPAHDQYAAALGAECVKVGDVLLSAGTAWVLLVTTAKALVDRQASFWPGRHVEPDKWGLLGAISCGNATLDSLLAMTRQGTSWDEINTLVSETPAGSEGVIILPHQVGRTLPTSNTSARGAILGLSLGHGRGHLWRAAMEAPALDLRVACDYLADHNVKINSLRMVGGAARSPVWPKIVASILGVPVYTEAKENIATRGAAMLAARAAGMAEIPRLTSWQEHLPEPGWQIAYETFYMNYLQAIEKLENTAS
jgi:xylulokinase